MMQRNLSFSNPWHFQMSFVQMQVAAAALSPLASRAVDVFGFSLSNCYLFCQQDPKKKFRQHEIVLSCFLIFFAVTETTTDQQWPERTMSMVPM